MNPYSNIFGAYFAFGVKMKHQDPMSTAYVIILIAEFAFARAKKGSVAWATYTALQDRQRLVWVYASILALVGPLVAIWLILG